MSNSIVRSCKSQIKEVLFVKVSDGDFVKINEMNQFEYCSNMGQDVNSNVVLFDLSV